MVLDIAIAFVSLVAVLFIPGYFLGLVFFTRKDEIDGIERILFSFVLSITFLPLLVLIENQLVGIPINAASVWGTFGALVVLGLAGYFARTGVFKVPFIEQLSKEEAVPLIPSLK